MSLDVGGCGQLVREVQREWCNEVDVAGVVQLASCKAAETNKAREGIKLDRVWWFVVRCVDGSVVTTEAREWSNMVPASDPGHNKGHSRCLQVLTGRGVGRAEPLNRAEGSRSVDAFVRPQSS